MREHADDSGSGTKLQDRFAVELQPRRSRTVIVVAAALMAVLATGLDQVSAQQEGTFPKPLPADFFPVSACVMQQVVAVVVRWGGDEQRVSFFGAERKVRPSLSNIINTESLNSTEYGVLRGNFHISGSACVTKTWERGVHLCHRQHAQQQENWDMHPGNESSQGMPAWKF